MLLFMTKWERVLDPEVQRFQAMKIWCVVEDQWAGQSSDSRFGFVCLMVHEQRPSDWRQAVHRWWWGHIPFQGQISWSLHSAWVEGTVVAVVVVAVAVVVTVVVDQIRSQVGWELPDSSRRIVARLQEWVAMVAPMACASASAVRTTMQEACSDRRTCVEAPCRQSHDEQLEQRQHRQLKLRSPDE